MARYFFITIWVLFSLGCTKSSENQKLCENGDYDSCVKYSVELFKENKHSEAETMFKKLCDQKNADACHRYAVLVGKRDQNEADEIYKRACEYGGDASCLHIALLMWYENKTDLTKKYLTIACNRGEKISCGKLKLLDEGKPLVGQ